MAPRRRSTGSTTGSGARPARPPSVPPETAEPIGAEPTALAETAGSAVRIGRIVAGGLLVLVAVRVLVFAPDGSGGVTRLAGTTGPAGPAVSVVDGRADERRCVECHEQALHFAETGHARTLERASEIESARLLARLEQSPTGVRDAVRVELRDDGPHCLTSLNGATCAVRLDWSFGSGTHARTWVSTLPDSFGATDLLEIRWSWYRQTGGFDITPGQPEQRGAGSVAMLGLQYDGPRAFRCFSCHASQVPVEQGRIDEDRIVPGVTCQRCHGPRQRHVETEGAFSDPDWSVTGRLKTDRLEAVHRCAECHRRVEEQPPEDIREDNPDIVRFQPVGLMQSACFLNSEMTCTTCHDPHRPLERQDSRGIRQCTQCHDPDRSGHVLCGAGRLDGCLDCHMPRVRMQAPLEFTDHWIRVRQPAAGDDTGAGARQASERTGS